MGDLFVLRDRPAHWWPVTIRVPVDDGKVVEQQLMLKFIRLDTEDFRSAWGLVLPESTTPEGLRAHNLELFKTSVADWKGIVEEVEGRKVPVPFNDGAIARALRFPGFMKSVEEAYLGFWAAVPETIRGNSEASPDGGQAGDAPTGEAPSTNAS